MKTRVSIFIVVCLNLLGITPVTAEKGVSGDTVLIGQTGVFTGPVAEPALQYRVGMQLYFDEVNAKGGVHGRKIKLASYDDQFNPKIAAENTRKLIEEDKVFAMVGYIGTGAVVASMPQINEQRVPIVGALSGDEGLRDPKNKLIFHTRASYGSETDKMVAQLRSTGVQAIAVVYQNDPFGKAGLKSAQAAFARHGVKPTIEAPLDMTKLEALDGTIAAVSKTQPGGIIMITAGKASTAFIRAYLKTGLRPWFFGVSVLSAKALIAALGEDARGIVIAQVVPAPTRGTFGISREFMAAAARAKSTDTTYNSLEGYITAKVFVEALRRAGKDLSRERLVSALESLNAIDLGGYVIDYSGGRRYGSNFVDLSIISKSGQFLH
ncbi:MAG: ABC transporter substrate-binding protein [Betaproteobacteria bacterium]|nr:ABC transporter substrate-binding protein [Betaproteobacteria bacterium]